MSQNVIAAQRLYLTADKEAVVAEGDERAAFLYAGEGDEIPAEMAEKFGLVDGALPDGEQVPLQVQLSDEELARIQAEAEAAAKAQHEAAEKAAAEAEAAAKAQAEADAAALAEKEAAEKAAADAAAAKAKAAAAAKPKRSAETKGA